MLMLYLAMIEEECDQATFEIIYNKHHGEMLRTAYDILRNKHDAEDAVQNALIGLATSIKSVPTTPDAMRAYSLVAARNAALKYKQKNAAWMRIESIDSVKISADTNVFDQIVVMEEYETLLKLMSELPLPIKEAMMLRYVADIPPKEIAKILGRKHDTVRKQLLRGKHMLIERYQEENHDA